MTPLIWCNPKHGTWRPLCAVPTATVDATIRRYYACGMAVRVV